MAVLAHPGMMQAFVVVADISTMAIWAVLSQRPGPKQIGCSITHYLRKLAPAEPNDEILNKELMAIKTIFEEWQYCLEGVHHTVQVFTDYMNLEYLCRAKVVNQRQLR